MPIRILELHHHAVRVPPAREGAAAVRDFYCDVLGLVPDDGRPDIPGVPGSWLSITESIALGRACAVRIAAVTSTQSRSSRISLESSPGMRFAARQSVGLSGQLEAMCCSSRATSAPLAGSDHD